MIIHANRNFNGVLDLGAKERIQETNTTETEFFRIGIRPGQSITVDDKWYNLSSIQSAISAGYIWISDYNKNIIGDHVSKITVGAIEPHNPAVGDLWVDLS